MKEKRKKEKKKLFKSIIFNSDIVRETGYNVNSLLSRFTLYKRISFILLLTHFICWNRDIIFILAI